ncbi:MAG: formylglycine-generating enzyme family protein [Treponema sp.]|nr:formylglycine-generating enzyme family protein [Treponema sp.]
MKNISILFIIICFAVNSLYAQQNNNMVLINGGTFIMGSPFNEPGRNENEITRQVTVSSFYMSKYPVTQKEFYEITGSHYSQYYEEDHPVAGVGWIGALEYCNELSRREGLTPVYIIDEEFNVTWNRNANGYRLPTEAEWEYACRAGTTTPFNTGNNITTSQANFNGNFPYNNNNRGVFRERTTPVGGFTPNQWGLYDMHGNVWEWCWDRFGDYTSGVQINPAGTANTHPIYGEVRILRGGGWSSQGQMLRSAIRGYSTIFGGHDRSNEANGFRLVRNAPGVTYTPGLVR